MPLESGILKRFDSVFSNDKMNLEDTSYAYLLRSKVINMKLESIEKLERTPCKKHAMTSHDWKIFIQEKTRYCALKLWIHSRIFQTPDSEWYTNFLSFAVVISSPSDSRFRISLLWNHTSFYMNKSNQRAIYLQDIQGINIQSIHVY